MNHTIYTTVLTWSLSLTHTHTHLPYIYIQLSLLSRVLLFSPVSCLSTYDCCSSLGYRLMVSVYCRDLTHFLMLSRTNAHTKISKSNSICTYTRGTLNFWSILCVTIRSLHIRMKGKEKRVMENVQLS